MYLIIQKKKKKHSRLWAYGNLFEQQPTMTYSSAPILGVLDDNVKSFVIHDSTVAGSPRRVCCDLREPRVMIVFFFLEIVLFSFEFVGF